MASISILVVICSVLASVHAGFTWSKCDASSNPVVKLDTITVSPDPIELPGDLRLTLRGNATRPLDNAKLSITLHRDTFLISIPIPCVLHLGSCDYDMCTLVDKMIAENWATVAAGLGLQVKTMLLSAGIDPTHCPIPASALVLNEYTLHLPQVPSVLSWLASGDYSVKVEVTDKTTNENLLCLNLGLTLTKASECTGWLCGRRKRDILKNKN